MRSPAKVGQKGLFQAFLNKSSLLKLEHDMVRGFDISVIPYHVRYDLRAWGLVLHPAGRMLEARPTDAGLVDLAYQGGICRSRVDWERLVARKFVEETDAARRFYNEVRILASGRIMLAGTVGFGLWDALWMSLDFQRSRRLLSEDPGFVLDAFKLWADFHMNMTGAMLDAGIKLILFREHPGGFPSGEAMTSRLDSLVGELLAEICQTVRSRGGLIFLDCDADEVFETDHARRWGFDGIGPLRFRDEEDLLAARKCLNEELTLIGTMDLKRFSRRMSGAEEALRGLIVTNNPMFNDARQSSVMPGAAPDAGLWLPLAS